MPPHLARELGISPGDEIRIEPNGHGMYVHPPVNTLKRVYVELTNRCNLNCSTCMRNVWDVQYGHMSMELFEQILASLDRVPEKPELFFGGYGSRSAARATASTARSRRRPTAPRGRPRSRAWSRTAPPSTEPQTGQILGYLTAKSAFELRCNTCHDLDRPLAAIKDGDAWRATVNRMAAMKPGAISDAEVRSIAGYLTVVRPAP